MEITQCVIQSACSPYCLTDEVSWHPVTLTRITSCVGDMLVGDASRRINADTPKYTWSKRAPDHRSGLSDHSGSQWSFRLVFRALRLCLHPPKTHVNLCKQPFESSEYPKIYTLNMQIQWKLKKETNQRPRIRLERESSDRLSPW